MVFFFKQKTAYEMRISDWSSDVCSSDLIVAPGPVTREVESFYNIGGALTGSAADVKLQTLKDRLTGGDQRTVAVLVSAEDSDNHPAQPTVQAFLRDLVAIEWLADRSTGPGLRETAVTPTQQLHPPFA